MSGSIVQAIARIKRNVAELLSESSIERACRAANYSWRRRKLGPAQTVWAFVLQVLHGNVSCAHTVRLAGLTCSAAAYCAARQRLPLALLQSLLAAVTRAARRTALAPRWRGHRTFLIDGSSCSMPDTPALQRHFGQSGQQLPGCGFPQAHLLALFDAATGLLIKLLPAPLRTHDQSQVIQLHPELKPGDVLVGDRAFASYVHLALILRQNLHAVFRAHQRQLISFRQDRQLVGRFPRGTVATRSPARLLRKQGRWDQLVEYAKPVQCPGWLDAAWFTALPDTLTVRELRYRTGVRGFRAREITLVTTLLDAARYPRAELAALYRRRWEIETNFACLKTIMKMDVLRCQNVEGVLKELCLFAIVYNLVRLVLLETARRQQVALQRLSFVDGLRWLSAAAPQPLALHVNPARPNRSDPRVRKRRAKPYPLLTTPRRQLKQLPLAKHFRA